MKRSIRGIFWIPAYESVRECRLSAVGCPHPAAKSVIHYHLSQGEDTLRHRFSHSRTGSYAGMMILSLSLIGCFRGLPSDKPPFHLNPNMDYQPKFKAQSANSFFADGAAMRPPVAGTVARGKLNEDDRYWRGVDPVTGKPCTESPVMVTEASLRRGQERYNITCSVCHGKAGDGQGIMLKKGYVPPPSFHSDLIRGYSDGQIFHAISEGIRNMPSYKGQITVEDRWLIVNYLRVLQRSQRARIEDVPVEQRAKLAGK